MLKELESLLPGYIESDFKACSNCLKKEAYCHLGAGLSYCPDKCVIATNEYICDDYIKNNKETKVHISIPENITFSKLKKPESVMFMHRLPEKIYCYNCKRYSAFGCLSLMDLIKDEYKSNYSNNDRMPNGHDCCGLFES